MQESLEMTEDLLRLKDYQVEMFADSISSKTQLFDSHEFVVSDQPAFRTCDYSFNGADFYFKFTLLKQENIWLTAIILRFGLAGFVLSFSIFFLVVVLNSAEDQARALAADLTIQYKRSEERLKIALQAAKESVWEWDLATNEVYFSPFGKADLGYADAEILNDLSSLEKLIHPDDFKTANINLQNFLSSEADYFENEFRMRHKDGHYLTILSKATKQFDESSSKLFRLIGTQIDVTEIREISRQLRESEARFRLMAENMIDVVWVLNLDQKRFTYISPSVFSLRGFTAEEALNQDLAFGINGLGNSVDVLSSYQDRAVLMKENDDLEEFFTDEVQLPCKNGDLIWVEIISRYQYNNDGEFEVLGVTRKIEERKRFEKLIMDKNDQLHDINSVKDKFFGIIAHDLRNPFLAINGMSELLLDNYKIFDQEKTIKYISSIASSSKNASQLLENLLLWAKSQSDTIQYIEEDIVLEVLLNNIVNELSANLSAKDMTINIEMNNPEIIKADRFMLSFIIRNLAGNAIKFSKRNDLIKIRSYRDKDKAIICVSDSGIGISLNDQKKLFKISDKFTVPGTENELGSGLGLLLCKEFVERNRGEIWVESEVGQGSSFYFSLSLANA
jgi:PAS domain S-box-containing protein